MSLCITQDYRLSDSPPLSPALWIQDRQIACISMLLRSSSTPQISLIRSTSATSATTEIVFIGLLSHMTPPPFETVVFSEPLISLFCFSDDLLCQIVVNQPVGTKIKYPRSVCYSQSLRIFILSQIIRK